LNQGPRNLWKQFKKTGGGAGNRTLGKPNDSGRLAQTSGEAPEGPPSANGAHPHARTDKDHPAALPSPADPRLEAVRLLAGPLALLAASGDLEGLRAVHGAVAVLLGTSSPEGAAASPPMPLEVVGPVVRLLAAAPDTHKAPPRRERVNASPLSPATSGPRARIDVVTDIAVARARREGRAFRPAKGRS
jgi:hypothetical protein